MGGAGVLFGEEWAVGGVGEPEACLDVEVGRGRADVGDRYANGKATALVVDVGHFNTSVTALWEGMVLKKSKSHPLSLFLPWFDVFP